MLSEPAIRFVVFLFGREAAIRYVAFVCRVRWTIGASLRPDAYASCGVPWADLEREGVTRERWEQVDALERELSRRLARTRSRERADA